MHPDSDSEALRKEAYKQFVQLGIYQKYLRPDDVERILIESGILTTPEPTLHSDMDTIDSQEDSDGQQSPCSSDHFCYSVDDRFGSAEPDEVEIFGKHSNPATENELRPSTFPIKLIQGVRNPIMEDVLITGRFDTSYNIHSFCVLCCPLIKFIFLSYYPSWSAMTNSHVLSVYGIV